jgi:hypothetical protein
VYREVTQEIGTRGGNPAMRDEKPAIGVEKLSDTRWIAYPPDLDLWDGDQALIAEGYAATEIEAVAAALVAKPGAIRTSHTVARAIHRRRVAERRLAAKPAGAATSATLDYVYSCSTSDYDGSETCTPHQVVKWTKRRIYIERQPGDLEASTTPERLATLRMRILDREAFDRDGYVKPGRGWWEPTYYRDPETFRRIREERWATSARDFRPVGALADALATLGVSWPCALGDVDHAYRDLAKATHPDRGGDAEAFIAIRAAYETARRLFPATAA